ncbi:MAG: Nuclear protein SET [Candidatus Woesebacteria bacterium GW2011_GWB1_38_5b]|uniref:Nuclear protein SET n=1 Tax=Candidatus Woesebacteria bacterium GW2011_GWB1_38_5b TaxID=1618569 RepID=A0A0G0K2T9_9BACT|nr:MAG: Nuclear protein SET [Candidatus Woesebacteria bacterium GW2011_GWB1_38_5b]
MKYSIEVKKIGKKGRGVFALKDFKRGEVIEKAPIIKLTPKERKHCEKTILLYYLYPWNSLSDAAIALGYGSIYNHSENPNAHWVTLHKSRIMKYRAIKDIEAGEEITVDYNGDYEPDDMDWLTPENQR